MQRREVAAAVTLTVALVTGAGAESAPQGGFLSAGALGNRKEPIIVTSDTLEYDYKANVVVYRGTVQASQGGVKLSSDVLTVTFAKDAKPGGDATKTAGSDPAKAPDPDPPAKGATADPANPQRVQEIVAVGNVRIDSGTRWATGGRAVFDQLHRTLVLTDNPVMHEGSNEIIGDRVVVYLDEDRSVVEGGRKRVKAVLYPDKDGGLAPAHGRKGAAPGSSSAPGGTPDAPAPGAAETRDGDTPPPGATAATATAP